MYYTSLVCAVRVCACACVVCVYVCICVCMCVYVLFPYTKKKLLSWYQLHFQFYVMIASLHGLLTIVVFFFSCLSVEFEGECSTQNSLQTCIPSPTHRL